jgi:hypothetical protein
MSIIENKNQTSILSVMGNPFVMAVLGAGLATLTMRSVKASDSIEFLLNSTEDNKTAKKAAKKAVKKAAKTKTLADCEYIKALAYLTEVTYEYSETEVLLQIQNTIKSISEASVVVEQMSKTNYESGLNVIHVMSVFSKNTELLNRMKGKFEETPLLKNAFEILDSFLLKFKTLQERKNQMEDLESIDSQTTTIDVTALKNKHGNK